MFVLDLIVLAALALGLGGGYFGLVWFLLNDDDGLAGALDALKDGAL